MPLDRMLEMDPMGAEHIRDVCRCPELTSKINSTWNWNMLDLFVQDPVEQNILQKNILPIRPSCISQQDGFSVVVHLS